MPGEMTDEKHMVHLNFVCSIVSSLLLRPIDAEPSIELAMNIEGSLKPMIQEWLADLPEALVDANDVHNFALQLAMKGVNITLALLTHRIVNQFKMRN